MPFLRSYNTAAVIDGVPLITRGAMDFKANPTLATGDVTISKDGGAYANITTLPTVTPSGGTSVEVNVSATELQCKRATIRLIDQTSPKEWEDQEVIIETFGNASAQFTGDLNNLDAAISSRMASGSNVVVSGYTATMSPAYQILKNISNPIDTDLNGLVNVGKINGVALAAAMLALSAGIMIAGAAVSGTLSNTEMTTNLTQTIDNFFNGRGVFWTSGVLTGQFSPLSGYVGSNKKLQYAATTNIPAVGDTFLIV